MATYPAILSSNAAVHTWSTFFALYTKFPRYPDVQTALADVDGGGTAYCRLVLTNGGRFFAEASYHGLYCRVDLTPHLVLLADHWYWIMVAMGATDQSHSFAPNTNASFGLVGKVTTAGGLTDGIQGVSASPGGFTDTVNCQIGWGVSLNHAYGDQHNEPGRLIAQPRIGIVNGVCDGLVDAAPPTADLLCTAIDGLYYPTHEPVGASATLDNLCGTGYTMDSGPNGLTIVRDSPY